MLSPSQQRKNTITPFCETEGPVTGPENQSAISKIIQTLLARPDFCPVIPGFGYLVRELRFLEVPQSLESRNPDAHMVCAARTVQTATIMRALAMDEFLPAVLAAVVAAGGRNADGVVEHAGDTNVRA